MNNARIVIEEEKIDLSPLREREVEIQAILKAVDEVVQTNGWKVLREKLFDPLVGALERQILSEARKGKIDNDKIQRLNGQLLWAKRYSNLESLAEGYKPELKNIKGKLYEND